MALDAFAAGKAVYVEKLALTVDAGEAGGCCWLKPLMVGHLIRHHAGFKNYAALPNRRSAAYAICV